MILDMLAPWKCVAALAEVLVLGGVFGAYVATTTQLAETVETLRSQWLYRAGGNGVIGPGLARGGTGGTAAPRYGRPHRICDHSSATGTRFHGTVTQTSPSLRRVRERLQGTTQPARVGS